MISQLTVGSGAVVVAIALSASALLSRRAPDRPAAPPAAHGSDTVRGATERAPTPGAAAGDNGYLGVVVALQAVEVAARFDGTLDRVEVNVGDHVREGAPIARLDSRGIARDLAIADSSLRAAQAEHDRLAIELEEAANRRARLESIAELVSREQIAAAESAEHVAAARLRGAAAELAGKRERTDQLKDLLRDTRIVAPFAGTVAARHVDAGTSVSRSTPIVRLISPSSVVVRFAVPEEEAAWVAPGVPVVVKVGADELVVRGTIERLVPEIDAALRMVVVEARVARSEHALAIPAGAIARVFVSEPLTAGTPGSAGRAPGPVHARTRDHARSTR